MLLKSLRGIIKFKAEGTKTLDFINEIKKSDLKCLNIHISGDKITGEISLYDFRQLKIIADEYHMELVIEEKKGIPVTALKYKKRYGIIIGFLAAFSMSLFLSNIVLKIEIQGNSVVSEEDLLDCLNENGISYGKFIPNLHFKETERKIQTAFEDISWNTISHKGGRVILEISEAEQPVKIVLDNIPCNIVSLKDAQITDMQVLNGRSIRQIGEVVKAGDTLVSGMYTDIHEKSGLLHSVGRITGEYKEKVVFEEFFSQNNIIETGKKETKTSVKILGLDIPLYFSKNKYQLSDIEEEIKYLEFFGYKTPIGIINQTFYEYSEKTLVQTSEEAKLKLEAKVDSYEKMIKKDRKIISKEVQEEETEEGIKRTILYVLEGEIGKQEIIAYSDNTIDEDVQK